MRLWHHNQDPTRNEQTWFWSKSGRIVAYLLMILGTILTFLLANLFSNIVQTLLVGILDRNSGLMSGNGVKTTFNFMLNSIWNWQNLFYNSELLRTIYLGGSQFFYNHGVLLSSLLKWGMFLFLFWHYDFYYIMRFYNRSSKLNHGEQGDDRLATPQEIGQETFKVPDRRYGYNFPSGLLVMHKMNIRGRINQFVKQQMMPTQKALQLRKDEDVGFKIIETFIFIVVVVFMAVGTLLDFGKPTNTVPIYSPVRLWRGIGDVLSFVFHDIVYNIIIFLWHIERGLVQAPLYVSAPVITIELVAVGYMIVHSYNHFTHANMTDVKRSRIDRKAIKRWFKAHWSLHHIQEKFLNWITELRKASHDPQRVNTREYDESQESQDNARSDDEPNETSKKADGGSDDDSKDIETTGSDDPYILVRDQNDVKTHVNQDTGQKTNVHPQAKTTKNLSADELHTNKWPVFRALYKIGMHPAKSAEYMFLNALNLLPLDRGITGYYYVNAKLMNVLIWGTTRSGKGQQMINTTIENNSRTKKQKKNMLINDSKGELSAGFYKTLKKRGYRVEVLNIIQMLHSMSYNPLELVKRHAIQGDVGQASKACSDLSYTLYQSGQSAHGQNAFFYNSAANVFDASVFALLAIAHGEVYGKQNPKLQISSEYDPNAFDKVTIANVVQLTTQLGGSQSTEVGADDDDSAQASSNQLIIFFKHLGDQSQKLRDLRDKRKNDDPEKYDGTNINPLTNVESDQLNLLDQALQKFNQSKMAGDEASGSIYSTFIEGLRIYQQPDVAKMTSMNSTNIEELGFDRLLTIQFNRAFNQQKVRVEIIAPVYENGKTRFKVIETDTSHLSTIGLSKIPIRRSIPYDHFYLRLTIHDERVDSENDMNVFKWLVDCHKTYYEYQEVKKMKNDPRQSPKVADIDLDDDKKIAYDHYTKQTVFKKIKMDVIYNPDKKRFSEAKIGQNVLNALASDNEESLRGEQLNFLYREQPTALFLVTPPDQQELNQLCTFLINQAFNTLYSLSSTITDERKVQRPLQMILDEVGNIPAIPNLDTKASIGLSAGLEMMLVFQDKKQIEKIYSQQTAGIVVANCATVVYILSHDDGTVKEVSDSFGNRTIKTSQLTTNPNGLNGTSKNYNLQKQAVMPMGRLRHLKIGEMAITRSTDRSDVWGNNTRPNPIFNTYWGHQNYLMPYAFWFLGDEISSDVSLSNIPVVTPHKYLDLNDLTINFNKLYIQMEAQNTMDNSNFHRILMKVKDKIASIKKDPDTTDNLDDQFKNAQKTKSLQKVLDIRDEYLDKDASGKETEYFDRIATVIDKLGSDKRVVDILHQFSRHTDVDLSRLRLMSERIFLAFGNQSINYYQIDTQDIDTLLRVVHYFDYNTAVLDDENKSASGTTRMLMIEAIRNVKNDFNHYLNKLGILNVRDNDYELTTQGRDFVQHAQSYMSTYDQKIIANDDDRGKIQGFLGQLLQILKAFYGTEYDDKKMKKHLPELREWTGLFIFRQFNHSKELAKLLTDDKGDHSEQITTFPVIQDVLGIFDNMYQCYQVKDDQKKEHKRIKTRKTSGALVELLDNLIKTNDQYNEKTNN